MKTNQISNVLLALSAGLVVGAAGGRYIPVTSDIYCGTEYDGWIVVEAKNNSGKGTSTYTITKDCRMEEITIPNNVWYYELDTIGKKHIDLKSEIIKTSSSDELWDMYVIKRDKEMYEIMNRINE
jgi:hypothetical protein